MTTSQLRIRPMAREDLGIAIEWARAEGWNPGLHDADAFFAADPQGFLLGEYEGRPAGCISAVSYGGAFGFIGFYIVAAPFRGRGFGMQLWKAAMARLEGQAVGLDGVFAQQENYARSGFAFAHRNIRFEWRGGGRGGAAVARVAPVVPLAAVPWPDLLAYDRRCFPAERASFLTAWARLPGSSGFGCIAGGQLRGYGVMRRCDEGFKCGPLFADDADIAEALWRELAAGVREGEPVYLDVPENNPAAMAMAARFGMKEVFGTARMYRGQAPGFDTARVFGVTTFELG